MHISKSNEQQRAHPLQPFEHLLFSTAPIHHVFLTFTCITLYRNHNKFSLRDMQRKLGQCFQNGWIPSKQLMKKSITAGEAMRLLHVQTAGNSNHSDELLSLANPFLNLPQELIFESHQLLQNAAQSVAILIDNLFTNKHFPNALPAATKSTYYAARQYIEFSILAFAEKRAPFTAAQFVQWWNQMCGRFNLLSQEYVERLLRLMNKDLMPHTTRDGSVYYYLCPHGHSTLLHVRMPNTGIESRLRALVNGFAELQNLISAYGERS